MGVSAKQIVLLGPDCAGKSTLAAALSKHYGIPVLPNRRISDDLDAVDSVLDFVRDVVRTGEEFILDQWPYPVDIVYNKTLRDVASPMELLEPIILPTLLKERVLFIHVDANWMAIRRRFDERGDELWNVEQILEVAQAYRDYFRKPKVHYRYLPTSYKTPEKTFCEAVVMIEDFYKEGM